MGPSTSAGSPAAATPELLRGGTVVVGTEAEVPSGLDPLTSRWDATGMTYASAVFDPLVAPDATGVERPFLAESVTPEAGAMSWTIRLRPSVAFTDGEPLDAAAVVANLEAQRASRLNGPVLASVVSVAAVDPATVRVRLQRPWFDFPSALAGPVGFPIGPRSIADPARSRRPVGTGPFAVKEWVPGSHLTLVRNPHYWRAGLPYLDSVEFRPLPDPQARESSLRAGTVDIIPTADTQTILDLRSDRGVRLIEQTSGRTDVAFVMLNTAATPVDDVRIRAALALATDRNRFNQVINNGSVRDATGPFSQDSGFSDAPSYPSADPVRAKALVDQYKVEHATDTVPLELACAGTGKSLQAAHLIADMWRRVGVDATVTPYDPATLIDRAFAGTYQAMQFHQFGQPDPDLDGFSWLSSDATSPGTAGLNMTRNRDPAIDAAVLAARSTSDVAKRRAAFTEVSARLDKDLPYLWTNEVLWAVGVKPTVQGVDHPTLPDGRAALPISAGRFLLAEVWLSAPR